jgi:hypothetical protein
MLLMTFFDGSAKPEKGIFDSLSDGFTGKSSPGVNVSVIGCF